MVFSSFTFLWVFLPLTLLINFVCLHIHVRLSNCFLLIASLLFYSWGEPKFIVLLLFSVTMNYLGGICIHRLRDSRVKKFAVIFFVLCNLLLLAYFKYFNFFAASLNQVLGREWIGLRSIALPIGISFYTFQAISYIIDLSRGQISVQNNWIDLALYIAFFPQLVAGPIVKYRDISDSLLKRSVSQTDFAEGLRRFCFGLAKKVLIANSLGKVTDDIWVLPSDQLSTILAWTAAVFYMLQIYFDFSGYSDMAIGLARLFGFRYQENFNFPYLSASIREFWRRWHISLSSWFRDYLYIPLGGSRKGENRTILNLAVVFFVTGLWHGAQWNFVFWGLFHGFFIILERLGIRFLPDPFIKKIPSILKHCYTLLIVLVGWVFFRAPNFSAAVGLLKLMTSWRSSAIWNISEFVSLRTILILGIALLLCGSFQKKCFPWLLSRVPGLSTPLVRRCANNAWAIFCLCASLVFLANAAHNPFIYFRF